MHTMYIIHVWAVAAVWVGFMKVSVVCSNRKTKFRHTFPHELSCFRWQPLHHHGCAVLKKTWATFSLVSGEFLSPVHAVCHGPNDTTYTLDVMGFCVGPQLHACQRPCTYSYIRSLSPYGCRYGHARIGWNLSQHNGLDLVNNE